MRNRFIAVCAVAVAALFLFAANGLAEGKCWKGDKGSDMKGKFWHKTQFILGNAEELGLSDDQVAKIKELQLSVKKNMIMKEAEIEIVAIDIDEALRKDQIDMAELGALVDKKFELKKETAKSLIGAYAELKGTLDNNQKAKMKAIWKRLEKEERGK